MKENNFKVIYRILNELEKSMDEDKIEENKINQNALDITENRWRQIMRMLAEEGYIKGLIISPYENSFIIANLEGAKITLKGLEYLSENSIMKKIANGIKEAKDIIPGI